MLHTVLYDISFACIYFDLGVPKLCVFVGFCARDGPIQNYNVAVMFVRSQKKQWTCILFVFSAFGGQFGCRFAQKIDGELLEYGIKFAQKMAPNILQEDRSIYTLCVKWTDSR